MHAVCKCRLNPSQGNFWTCTSNLLPYLLFLYSIVKSKQEWVMCIMRVLCVSFFCSTMTLNVNQIDSLIYKLIKNDDKKRASSWHRGRGTCPNYLILIHACLSNENYSLTLSCPVNRGAYCCVAQWETGLLFSESSWHVLIRKDDRGVNVNNQLGIGATTTASRCPKYIWKDKVSK